MRRIKQHPDLIRDNVLRVALLDQLEGVGGEAGSKVCVLHEPKTLVCEGGGCIADEHVLARDKIDAVDTYRRRDDRAAVGKSLQRLNSSASAGADRDDDSVGGRVALGNVVNLADEVDAGLAFERLQCSRFAGTNQVDLEGHASTFSQQRHDFAMEVEHAVLVGVVAEGADEEDAKDLQRL